MCVAEAELCHSGGSEGSTTPLFSEWMFWKQLVSERILQTVVLLLQDIETQFIWIWGETVAAMPNYSYIGQGHEFVFVWRRCVCVCVCLPDRVLWGESLALWSERSKQTSVHSGDVQQPRRESVGSLWNWFLIIRMKTISSDLIGEETGDWCCLLMQEKTMNKKRWNFKLCK